MEIKRRKRIREILACCLTAACLFSCALGENYKLPANLKTIEEEAFFGNAALEEVDLPDGLEYIESKAFVGSGLTEVYLPSSLIEIANDAFDDPDTVTITAEKQSYAYRWAFENGYFFTCIKNGDGTLTITGYREDDAELVIPEAIRGKTVTMIGEGAFNDNPNLINVSLPATLISIGAGAFEGCGETLWLHCYPGDLATELLNQGIDVDAGTTCRALLIGQTYPESDRRLAGPANDIAAMGQMLTHLDHMDFQVTACSNLTKDGILSAVGTAFGEAGIYDISLFYYSGHGNSNGSLVGCNDGTIGESISPAELRNAMEGIPGRKVLIIDACYSGAFVPDNSLTLTGRAVLKKDYATSAPSATVPSGTEEQPDPGEFNTAFMNVFSSAASGRRKLSGRSAGTAFSSYYVMSACASNEESFEWPFSGISRGIFTKFLCDGIGWHSGQQGSGTKSADTNEDQLVTFGEAFTYAKNQTREFVEEKRDNAAIEQNAQSNAGDLQSFSPFR